LCKTGRVKQSLGCELVGGVQEMPSAVLATAIQNRVTNAKHYFFPAALQGIQKSRFSGKPLILAGKLLFC
jgi:hypothetical protein